MGKPEGSILRSTLIIGGFTGLSRLLGFVREVLMAVMFGTSLAKSAFDVAFRIPNLFRRLFGEGALSAAFIPVFTRSLKEDGRPAAEALANRMTTLLAVALGSTVLAGLLGIAGMRQWATLGERSEAVLPLLQIMLPYALFICLAALCMAVLNALGHFAVPAAAPMALNVLWIAVLLWVCPFVGDTPAERIVGLAWGILAAGALQFAMQIPALERHGIRLRLARGWSDRKVHEVLRIMAPAALGMGVTQVNVIVDGFLALFVGAWAPAALTYAERLVYLPLGLFATAMGTVLLPTFSRQAAGGASGEIASTLARSIRILMLPVIPAAAGLLVLAPAIVDLSFAWRGGAFDARSAVLTTRALRFYALGLATFSLYKLLVPVFYAFQDTRTPMLVGAAMVALNLALNVTFILTWPEGWGHAGLACATVIASAANCLALARLARRRIGAAGWPQLGGLLLRVLAATALMAAVAEPVRRLLLDAAPGWGLGLKAGQLLSVAIGILAGAAVYAVAIRLLCPQLAAEFLSAMRHRKRGITYSPSSSP